MRWLENTTDSMDWIWANSKRYWRTEEPGVLQSMWLQRVGHNLATEPQQANDNLIAFTMFLKSESEVAQSCPTLWNPVDCSQPGFSVHGILQARTLEWVAISFSNAWKWKVKVKLLSHAQLFATPWTAAYQAPPSMGFFRQEYCWMYFTLLRTMVGLFDSPADFSCL